MSASLPMYATPLTAGADARLWSLIRDGLRAQGIDAPETLSPPPSDLIAHWRDPQLVFSQTCGFPFRAVLMDDVSLIGTPDYGVAGCPPGYYRSYVVARKDDPRSTLSAFTTAPFAYNDPMSQSGWAALALEAPEVLRGARICTGGHRLSALAVCRGDADFATIDAVTWLHLEAAGETAGLKIVHRTTPTPGLPYITAKSGPAGAIFDATVQAITMLTPQDRATLHLKGLITLSASTYALPLPPPV